MAASSRSDSGFLQLLENNYLECNLCFDIYKKPKYLNCHHTFCEGCLTEYIKHNPGDIFCPTCRVVTKVPKDGGIPALQNNFLITSLADEASWLRDEHVKCDNCSEYKMAAMVCVECAAYLCDDCYNAHQTVKMIRDSHNTFEVKMLENVGKLQKFQRNRFSVCPQHNEPMKLYCKTERKQLCHTCAFSTTHKSHEVCPIQEQLDHLLAEISGNIERNQIHDSLIASEKTKLETLISEAEKTTAKSLADIEKELEKVIQQVREKYNTIRREIKEANQESVDICKSKMAQNQALQNSVKSKITEYDALRVIPISSGVEAAEGLLERFSKMDDRSAVQKRELEDEQKLKYLEENTNDKNFVVNVGCVKNKDIVSSALLNTLMFDGFQFKKTEANPRSPFTFDGSPSSSSMDTTLKTTSQSENRDNTGSAGAKNFSFTGLEQIQGEEGKSAVGSLGIKSSDVNSSIWSHFEHEDEEALYTHMAQLFRWDGNQWKEKGVGDIRILRHREMGTFRLLMRREKLLNICLNHQLIPELELKPMHNDYGKAWVWYAEVFSEGEMKHEQLAIRFNSQEIADQFKSVFDEAKQHEQGKLTEPVTPVDCNLDKLSPVKADSCTPKTTSTTPTFDKK